MKQSETKSPANRLLEVLPLVLQKGPVSCYRAPEGGPGVRPRGAGSGLASCKGRGRENFRWGENKQE